jgi:hypothetical protein
VLAMREDLAVFVRPMAAKSHCFVHDRQWRATVDEDGQYSFAVAL